MADILDHLTASLPASMLDAGNKANDLRQIYISSERDEELQREINILVETVKNTIKNHRLGKVGKPPKSGVLVVTGESGAGKSTALMQALKNHSAFPDYDGVDISDYIITTSTPASPTFGTLGCASLHAMGYPIKMTTPAPAAWQTFDAQLSASIWHFIHYDEFHDLLTVANAAEKQKIINMLKKHVNDRKHPVAYILSGTPKLIALMCEDPELRRRTRFLRLRSLDRVVDADEVAGWISQYCAKAGLAENLPSDIAPRLIHAADLQFGMVTEMICDATMIAFQEEDCAELSLKHFAADYAQRNDVGDNLNPFKVEHWREVDCRLASTDDANDATSSLTHKWIKK